MSCSYDDEVSTVVIYFSDCGTLMCAAGDVQPTYAPAKAIAAEWLISFGDGAFGRDGEGPDRPAALSGIDSPSKNSTETGSIPCGRRMHPHLRSICATLRGIARGRRVVAVVPLLLPSSSTNQFYVSVAVFLLHAVEASSLVMTSDLVSGAVACTGQRLTEGLVVVDVSYTQVALALVKEANTTRHTVSGAVNVAALMRAGGVSTGSVPDDRGDVAAADESDKLFEEPHRAALVSAFGLKVYYRAWRRRQRELAGDAASTSGKSSPLPEWVSSCEASQLEVPGELEKLLSRVCHPGTFPALLTGSALRLRCVRLLVEELVLRCGEKVYRVAEREAAARRRARRESAEAAARQRREADAAKLQAMLTLAPTKPSSASASPVKKQKKKKPGLTTQSRPKVSPKRSPRAKGRAGARSAVGRKRSRSQSSSSSDEEEDGDEETSADGSVSGEESGEEDSSSDEESNEDDDEEEEQSEETDEEEEEEDEQNEDDSDSDSASASSLSPPPTVCNDDDTDAEDSDGESGAGGNIRGDWLYLTPAPLPQHSWLSPLLGGSMIGSLSSAELSRAIISRAELDESQGTVVLHKTML